MTSATRLPRDIGPKTRASIVRRASGLERTRAGKRCSCGFFKTQSVNSEAVSSIAVDRASIETICTGAADANSCCPTGVTEDRENDPVMPIIPLCE